MIVSALCLTSYLSVNTLIYSLSYIGVDFDDNSTIAVRSTATTTSTSFASTTATPFPPGIGEGEMCHGLCRHHVCLHVCENRALYVTGSSAFECVAVDRCYVD